MSSCLAGKLHAEVLRVENLLHEAQLEMSSSFVKQSRCYKKSGGSLSGTFHRAPLHQKPRMSKSSGGMASASSTSSMQLDEAAALRAKNFALQTENASLRAEIEATSLRAKNAALEAENASLRGKMAMLEVKCASLRDQLTTIAAENAALLRAKNAALEEEHLSLQKKMEYLKALHNSSTTNSDAQLLDCRYKNDESAPGETEREPLQKVQDAMPSVTSAKALDDDIQVEAARVAKAAIQGACEDQMLFSAANQLVKAAINAAIREHSQIAMSA
eukprot:CAMPEP_0119319240 /NCGR_PEP_ID=MMETSP1333-20130426/48861_1 /TAXON_ID=418940 /ORGANISM="Scyphosphaera apsteinii, Strain RCC1455" /LENGTH=273 /DNA_ID=CAMNT_0007325601 /DNA_START=41 /DNA_END=862 /DNA_ORIENTATION=-